MKVVISGIEYDGANLAKISLMDAMEIKKATGLSLADIQRNLSSLAESGVSVEVDEEAAGEAFLDNIDGLRAVGAFIWLTRRKAGEQLTFEQAADFPLSELSFIDDEPEAAEEPNPT